jgi:MFS family permease
MDVRSRIARLRERRQNGFQAFKDRSRLVRVFRHRDFKLLWGGAFLSFVGSWIQKIAEGYLVFQLTHDKALLALVIFIGSVPTSILGPLAGTLADTFDRRKLLVVAQSVFAAGSLYLAAATYFNFVTYWQIIGVALILGIVSTVEQPVRQSMVGSVVPPEDLPIAIPINAMTFNLSRIIGPAIGGVLLATVGTFSCYLLNGLSFFALIFAALAIRSDQSAKQRGPQPIRDLITEGALYTFRERRLRTLFVLEAILSTCGLIYVTQLPAIATEMFASSKRGLAICSTAVGIGAMTALVLVMQLSERGFRAHMIRSAMTLLGLSLLVLSIVRNEFLALPVFAVLGMCAITQFNLTNTLFQTLAPPRLRGRVLAMHIWAVNGLGPFGVLASGYIAQAYGLPFALQLGGAAVLAAAIWAWIYRQGLEGLDYADEPS